METRQRDRAGAAATASRGPWSYLWWLVSQQRGRVALGAALGTAWMAGLAVPPYLLSQAFAALAEGRRDAALTGAVALVAAGAVLAWLGIWRHRTMTRVRMDAAYRTVSEVNAQAARLGVAVARRSGTGEVVTVGGGDAWTIGRSLTVTGPGVGAVVAYGVIAVLLLRTSVLLAVVVLAGIPVLAVVVGGALGRLQAAGAPYRALQGRVTARVVDVVAGLGVLNGLGGKQVHAERFGVESRALQELGYRLGRVTSTIQAAGLGLPALFSAVVVWLAARLAVQGALTAADLVAVFGYVAVLAVPVATFIESTLDISQALVAARRVSDFLALTRDDDETRAPVLAAAAEPLVDGISGLSVTPGAFAAVATARQADAEALLERLAGLRPGATLAGRPVQELDPAQLRTRVLLADHEAHLFAGSLADVVAGRRGVEEVGAGRLRSALHAAAADDLFRGRGAGLEARVEGGGANLSGGQRQRLRLARAVAADPPVLLAVDPTSALDAATEALVVERLRSSRRGKTTVVTSTSTLVLHGAQEVHLLVGDRVVASGTHDRLLADEPAYSALVRRRQGPNAGPAGDDSHRVHGP